MSFQPIASEIASKLWPHQREALAEATKYLNSTTASPFLIRMPTGTGKSGVIGCLTRISCPGTSLVLTPWAHLRDQMVSDVSRVFWERRGITLADRKVRGIIPANISKVLEDPSPLVLVSTFAALNQIRRNRPDQYEQLADRLDLVIADEGHYEPALEWGKSVRQLKAPTVLLTATPYRNDLKLFRIEEPKKATFHFTHAKAEENKIIRETGFKTLDGTDIPSLCKSFIGAWEAALKQKHLPSKEPRAIICCDDDESIERTVSILRHAKLSAIGIHDQFKGRTEDFLKVHVPRPANESSTIWVHQHKLMEGLDDDRFCCLALFGPIRSDRKLVQQIGRVLRKGTEDRKKPALVLSPSEYGILNRWQAYRDFEHRLELLDPNHFRRVVDEMVSLQPDVEYFAGRFRRRFDPSLSTTPGVILPPSVLVRRCSDKFTLADYIEDCTDTLNLEDAVNLGPKLNSPIVQASDHALWVYATVTNSRLLSESSLYEVRLETHCVVVAGDLVFMADSAGNVPYEYLEDCTRKLSSSTLGRFVDDRFRPTHVSVNSVMPYETVVRSAVISGQNLLSVAASLTDKVHICRTIRGTSTQEGRRSVNLTKSRVRKEIGAEERRQFGLREFRSWANEVAGILRSSARQNPLLDRYMHPCDPPASIIPATLCIDFERNNVEMSIEDGESVWLKNGSGQVVASKNGAGHECILALEYKEKKDGKDQNETLVLGLNYDRHRHRFRFHVKDGPSIQVSWEDTEEGPKTKSLSEYLDQEQDLLLIGLADGEIVYQGTDFFEINYDNAERALIDLVRTTTGVQSCASEKGTEAQIENIKKTKSLVFPNDSLFEVIRSKPELIPFDPELLICDDLGTECADFVAVNFSRKQFALIHAKSGSGSAISASSFHEVVGQAMKNMVHFSRSSDKPAGLSNWTSSARWNKTSIPRVLRTATSVPKTGAVIWSKVKSDIIGSSSPELHLVLVTTGCCQAKALKAAVKDKGKRTPELAQLVHLLDGLRAHAGQHGVKLLIHDVPFKSAKPAKTSKSRATK